MRGQSFLDRLKKQFGDQITGSNLEAIDPGSKSRPRGWSKSARYLRDEPDLRFDMLELITGVDYFEPDAKKAAKVTWQPHMEVVYHLWSVPNRVSLVLKVMLPRWKNDVAGRTARSAHGQRHVAHGRLARARSVRLERRAVHRPPQLA